MGEGGAFLVVVGLIVLIFAKGNWYDLHSTRIIIGGGLIALGSLGYALDMIVDAYLKGKKYELDSHREHQRDRGAGPEEP